MLHAIMMVIIHQLIITCTNKITFSRTLICSSWCSLSPVIGTILSYHHKEQKIERKMSSSDEPSSSRSLIMLFILGWGLVLVAAFARSVYLCIMKVFGGNDRLSNDGTRNMRTSGGRILVLELYRTMSSERKEEIENLRKNALLRYLSGFTLVRIII